MRKLSGNVLIFFVTVTFFSGCVVGGCVATNRARMADARAVYAPFPHHVAPAPDAASFRFAMVHDVIHERYPRHGPAYYEERERLARAAMAVLHRDSENAFPLTDDIAVGLDRRGRTEEATALMRDKLERQQAVGHKGKELYSTYANLGEFLVRGNLWAMCCGDAEAQERVLEGREFLRKSLEMYPNAHFGREEWQLVAIDSLIDAGNNSELIQNCDLIGNRLDRAISVSSESIPRRAPDQDMEAAFGRPYHRGFTWMLKDERRRQEYTNSINDPAKRAEFRRYIFPVGHETPPNDMQDVKRGRRAPFDEPAMWLIGEWRQGVGPNPHAALCLGEIMLRVGQRYLAWSCYERASRMGNQFWPTREAQDFLRDQCQRRQAAIERSLPSSEVATLRPQFEAELAFGKQYQRDYQAYAEEKIQSGANLNDPHFFDEFHAERPPIASKVGPEEWYAGESSGITARLGAFWEWGALTGGACVLLLALIANWIYRPRLRLRLTEVNPPP
jgi:hypothetical protein